MTMLWFVKLVGTPTIKGWGGGGERELVIVQYVEVTAPLNVVGRNLLCICVRWSTPEEIHHSACDKKPTNGNLEVW